jgi:hypothetical protein
MINVRDLELQGCPCAHCECDCDGCQPVTFWFLLDGAWISDRNIMLRKELVEYEYEDEPIVRDLHGLEAMLAAEPADKITQAHFAGRYLDAIEAEGLRIVPATDTITEIEWDAVANRFHLIMQGTERVGLLMPLRHPDSKLGSRTPKEAA